VIGLYYRFGVYHNRRMPERRGAKDLPFRMKGRFEK
jgi:hypothetical protein